VQKYQWMSENTQQEDGNSSLAASLEPHLSVANEEQHTEIEYHANVDSNSKASSKGLTF
jgi:hypothetical protein